jgi:peroxiredoxin
MLSGISINDKLFLEIMKLLMRSAVMAHITSFYVMPEVSPLTICGDRLNRASSVFLDSPVKPGNDKNVTLLMNSLVTPFIIILFLLLFTFFHADSVFAKTSSSAPDFTLNDISGKPVTLSQFRGKVIILNFWSIWCGPCLAEMPSLNKLYLEFKDKGLIVLSLAEDPAEKPVKSYIQDKGIAFPILMDKDKKIYLKYSLFGIPVTFLIDKKGLIAEKFIGERDWSSSEMRGKVSKLLQK